MVHVLALIAAKPGQRAALLEAFQANVPAVLNEAGCIEYGAAVDADGVGSIQTPLGPDSFVVIEKWESLEALRAHGKAPHMAAFAERAKDLIATRTLHVFSPA